MITSSYSAFIFNTVNDVYKKYFLIVTCVNYIYICNKYDMWFYVKLISA